MFAGIIFKLVAAAILTCAGTLWIDKLYWTSKELTFPGKISERSKFRKPFLFVSLAILFNMTEDLWKMAAFFLLVLMTLTDFEQYMLFDAMTLPFALIGAFYAWQNANLTDNLITALIGGGFFLFLAIVSKGAIGGGDVKLIAALGLWLGSENLLDAVIFATIVGGLAATFMILAKQKDRSSYFAYGPYFALSAIYFLLK